MVYPFSLISIFQPCLSNQLICLIKRTIQTTDQLQRFHHICLVGSSACTVKNQTSHLFLKKIERSDSLFAHETSFQNTSIHKDQSLGDFWKGHGLCTCLDGLRYWCILHRCSANDLKTWGMLDDFEHLPMEFSHENAIYIILLYISFCWCFCVFSWTRIGLHLNT